MTTDQPDYENPQRDCITLDRTRLKDRYGLSWQIVPARLPELLRHPDPAVAKRVMEAMMPMTKIDIALLEAAAAGR